MPLYHQRYDGHVLSNAGPGVNLRIDHVFFLKARHRSDTHAARDYASRTRRQPRSTRNLVPERATSMQRDISLHRHPDAEVCQAGMAR